MHWLALADQFRSESTAATHPGCKWIPAAATDAGRFSGRVELFSSIRNIVEEALECPGSWEVHSAT